MQEEKDREESSNTDQLIKDLTEHINNIKQNNTKLNDNRTKTVPPVTAYEFPNDSVHIPANLKGKI